MSKDVKSEKKGGAAAKEKKKDPKSKVNEGTKSPTSEKSVEVRGKHLSVYVQLPSLHLYIEDMIKTHLYI